MRSSVATHIRAGATHASAPRPLSGRQHLIDAEVVLRATVVKSHVWPHRSDRVPPWVRSPTCAPARDCWPRPRRGHSWRSRTLCSGGSQGPHLSYVGDAGSGTAATSAPRRSSSTTTGRQTPHRRGQACTDRLGQHARRTGNHRRRRLYGCGIVITEDVAPGSWRRLGPASAIRPGGWRRNAPVRTPPRGGGGGTRRRFGGRILTSGSASPACGLG